MDDLKFNKALRHTIRWEGGDTLTNDPDDPGGRTIYGISEAAHPEAWQDGPPEYSEAREIYYSAYWLPCRCEDLPPALAFVLFDTAVNIGAGRARKLLQEAVGSKIDGIIGPNTLEAIRNTGNPSLNLSGKRAEYYASLDMPQYYYGWMRRTLDTYAAALEL